ncbi:MAG: peptidoglycan DD-metalloendopeptidase family protein [Pseudomonadota bacterium]
MLLDGGHAQYTLTAMRLILFFSLFLLSAAAIPDQEAEREVTIKEEELEQVQRRIEALKESLDRNTRERDRVTSDLQSAEIRIAETRRRLDELKREQEYAERRKAELDAQIVAEEEVLETEVARLGEQVRSAYMSGNQERLKLLLNQQDPAMLGRMFAYYEYFNAYRADNISRVNTLLAQLNGLRTEAAAEAARLTTIAQRRYQELTALNEAQEDRRTLLADLNERMRSQGSEIETLTAQEAELQRLLDELTTILSDYPIRSQEPFEQFRGRLTWPVSGNRLYDFGDARAGGKLKWNGVVLRAPRGREVRAVYHGRVMFADWLAGMGLLLIVDHGDGYLTLYGYNETLLKDAGDWVAPGDVVATVGDSGGQAEPSLYFELRKGDRPLDPSDWVTRLPGQAGNR